MGDVDYSLLSSPTTVTAAFLTCLSLVDSSEYCLQMAAPLDYPRLPAQLVFTSGQTWDGMWKLFGKNFNSLSLVDKLLLRPRPATVPSPLSLSPVISSVTPESTSLLELSTIYCLTFCNHVQAVTFYGVLSRIEYNRGSPSRL